MDRSASSASGLVVAGLVWSGRRVFDRRRASDHPPYRQLAAVSLIGVLLHVLMDLPTAYGTRLFSPFDWHWYAIDVMPIVDFYLLAALAAGLVFVGRSAAARSRNAALVLALMVANYGLRGAAHQRALNLAPQIFGSGLPARCEWPAGVPDRRPVAAPGAVIVKRGSTCMSRGDCGAANVRHAVRLAPDRAVVGRVRNQRRERARQRGSPFRADDGMPRRVPR